MSIDYPHSPRIDALQYANWSSDIFEQLREGRVDAVHVTIAYHENFRETVLNFEQWNRWFELHEDLIMPGRTAHDIVRAQNSNRTAVFFGFQTPSPMEEDLGLIQILHQLGARFMQLSYNNQSLLATGCYEAQDSGITRFGKEAIREMNRVGLVIDMSHSAERSTLEAIELSERPIAITHANPAEWCKALRNKSAAVIQALSESGGMLGFSLYPHHLLGKSECTLESFAQMVANAADKYGVNCLGLGSDLCQNQPDSIVTWMRNGRWSRSMDYGEGTAASAGFPAQPEWFEDNRGFDNIARGLLGVGFSDSECDQIMGGNWARFFQNSFNALDG